MFSIRDDLESEIQFCRGLEGNIVPAGADPARSGAGSGAEWDQLTSMMALTVPLAALVNSGKRDVSTPRYSSK